jgi:glycosyltransferase involved in cell wall biosynthesis
MYIGGVEIGIEKSYRNLQNIFDYQVFWVKRKGDIDIPKKSIFYLIWGMALGGWRPDAVVTSLWYSHLFGLFFKLFGIKWIAFFHNSGFSHGLDKLIHIWAWRRAAFRLVDSIATKNTMVELSRLEFSNVFLIPYNFSNPYDFSDGVKEIGCIWVGRNVSSKRFDLFLEIIKNIREWSDMKCIAIVAEIEPLQAAHKKIAEELNIQIMKNKPNNEVLNLMSKSKYYILTSDYEGMSMTTVEAIQSGCIPVVRPVGEIPSYLCESAAVYLKNTDHISIKLVSEEIRNLECDENSRKEMQRIAQDNIRNIKTYNGEFINAMNNFLK